MRKLFLGVFFVLLVANFVCAAGPFIAVNPSNRVEYFEVMINDGPPKQFQPREDDSLVLDVIQDLNLKSQSTKAKITLTAVNSDGYSDDTSFHLHIYKTINATVYRIIPIEEVDNQLYMSKYQLDQLEVAIIKETGGGKKGGGGFSFFGLF